MLDVQEFFGTIPETDDKIGRGLVGCKQCGRVVKVNGAKALRYGWPKCHEQTMTLDVEKLPTSFNIY